MKIIYTILGIFLVLIISNSCENAYKEPSANIVFYSNSNNYLNLYLQGTWVEEFKTSNSETEPDCNNPNFYSREIKTHRYRWCVKDSKTGKSWNIHNEFGELTLPNGECKSIFLDTARGQVMFWSDNIEMNYDIYFNENKVYEFYGSHYQSNNEEPNCGQNNNPTFSLAPGIYESWYVIDLKTNHIWNKNGELGPIEVHEGLCTKIYLREPTNQESGIGQAMFWTNAYGRHIDIYLNDEWAGEISSAFWETPPCGQENCVTLDLEEGIYNNWYAIERENGYIWNENGELGSFEVNSSYCTKIFIEKKPEGQALFWTDYGTEIDIYIDDQLYENALNYCSYSPDCSDNFITKLKLSPGIYTNWYAIDKYNGYKWNENEELGAIEITNDNCTKIHLNKPKGKLMFWTSGNNNIEVYFNDPPETITSYYPNGAPDCNANGCVTLELPIGTYSNWYAIEYDDNDFVFYSSENYAPLIIKQNECTKFNFYDSTNFNLKNSK